MAGSEGEGKLVRARAWCRVDLAGGTLDIWPLGLLHPSSRTVNVALDLAVEVELAPSNEYVVLQGSSKFRTGTVEELVAARETSLLGLIAVDLDLPPVEIRVKSASPPGGGLGASSALAVATIAAGEALLDRPVTSPEERSALARDLEARLMSLPTGRQDHFPALLGGVLEIEYRPGGDRVRRLDVDLERLGDSLLVAYTGESHFSAGNNWRIVRSRLDGDAEMIELFDGIRDVAASMARALEAGDLGEAGRLMGQEWGFRRRLAEGVSTPTIERLLEGGLRAGAWGGKACGAGGGGCIALLTPPERREQVSESLTEAGAELLTCRPTGRPLEVEGDAG